MEFIDRCQLIHHSLIPKHPSPKAAAEPRTESETDVSSSVGPQVIGGLAESFGEVVGYAIADIFGVLPSRAGGGHGGGTSAEGHEVKIRDKALKQYQETIAEMANLLVQSERRRVHGDTGKPVFPKLQEYWNRVAREEGAAKHAKRSPRLLTAELARILDFAVVGRCIKPYFRVEFEEVTREVTETSHDTEHGNEKGGGKSKSGRKKPEPKKTPVTTLHIKLPSFTKTDEDAIRERIRELLHELDTEPSYESFLDHVDDLKNHWLEAHYERAKVEFSVAIAKFLALNREAASYMPLVSDPDTGFWYGLEKTAVVGGLTFITFAVMEAGFLGSFFVAVLTALVYHRRKSLHERLTRWQKEMKASAPRVSAIIKDSLRSLLARRPGPSPTSGSRARKRAWMIILILAGIAAAIGLAYLITR